MTPTIKTMVTEHLKKHGYDGLWSGSECCCTPEDLMPCGFTQADCQAGYQIPCPDDCEHKGYPHFHIGPKEKTKNENTG